MQLEGKWSSRVEVEIDKMPKKFKGENSKATAAKERKAAAREAAEQEKRQKEEDEYWRDDHRLTTRKQERKVLPKSFCGLQLSELRDFLRKTRKKRSRSRYSASRQPNSCWRRRKPR